MRGAGLLAVAIALAPAWTRAAEPDLRCPAGTSLRTSGLESRCETPFGVAEGPTYGRYRDGALRYYGTSRDGKTDGAWTNWNPDGTRSIEATYANGELTGPFRRFDAHGVLQSEGNHDRQGEMDGTWTSYWPNGRPRVRWTMAHGAQQGPVTTWYESGAMKSEGRRAAGRPDGAWTWWAEDGAVTAKCRYEAGRVAEGECAAPTP